MEYPRSWYPLCRSRDLKAGSVIPVEALGHKLAVFRTRDQQVGALKAQCCHIGADLSRGKVEGDHLRCPLHHWAFDVDGVCQNIPCQNEIPSRIHQTALRCSERYGLVYAFLGEEEDFPFPHYSEFENSIISTPRIIDFDAPYEMASANSFDEQHLATVHRRKVIGDQIIRSCSPYHFSVEYKAEVTPHTLYDKILHLIGKKIVHMKLDCWGGNLLLFSHVGTPNKMIISLLPISENRSRAFISTVLPRGQSLFSLPLQWITARLLNWFTLLFVRQDIQALQGIEFKFINMLPEADTTMIQWYQYWKRLPRTSFGCSKIQSQAKKAE